MKGVLVIGEATEIIRIIYPVALAGAIGLFVILRLKNKHSKNSLGKKQSKSAQTLLDSLIPLGLLFGSLVGIVLSIFTSMPLLSTVNLGAATGLLAGYFAYEIYSKKEGTSSQ
ncbi:hypothetical protein ACTHOQ_15275 [Solibacillus silvestris]|uniref:hypothetical protein n=1 Tax=Solibacillus silvestris TaxID=76853 RepID=UPI003F8116E4